MLHKLIYILGAKKRNPSLFPYFNFLVESDRWSKEQLKKHQIEQLRKLLKFAYSNSPYYTELFDKINLDPANITSLEDMERIPCIDKTTLIEKAKEIQSRYPFKSVHFVETSGTSGQVLHFYRNEEWDSRNRASIMRGYSWYGVNPWDRNGYFWGYNIDAKKRMKTKLLDWMQNRFRVFSYSDQEIRKFADRLKGATFISGYSSMIYEVSKLVNKMGLAGKFNLKMIKGTSEKIYDSYQDEVQKAFGHKMISEYGATEAGIIAFECPEGRMHVNMENVILEEIDGEAYVTNLNSYSFPIIRYKIGDSIKLADRNYKCPCGRQHDVLLEVLGRVGKRVEGKVNNYPSLTFYYVFKNLTFTKGITLNYQAIQNEKGKIMLKIEQSSQEYEKDVRNELTKYFKDDIDFTILWGETLHAMNGKLKDFITTLN